MTNQAQDSTDVHTPDIEQDINLAKEELAGAAKVQAEAGKDKAADKLNDLSDVIDEVANSISENDKLGIASYVRSASSQLASLAGRLQDSSMDELAHDAKELARRKPTAFMLGSVVVGFGLSRFVKASTHHAAANRQQAHEYQPAADFGGSEAIKSYADPASPYPSGAEI